MTAVEKIIAEINNELQTLESLHGKEIFGRKVGLAFAKRVAEQAKEMEKQQIIDADFAGVKRTINEICKYIYLPLVMKDIERIENGLEKHEDGEQYFNETFKNK